MALATPQPSTNSPFSEGPDLSRLSGPGLRAFLNLAEVWELTLDEQRSLLGGVSRSTYTRWRRDRDALLSIDQLERVSHLLGIFEALGVLTGQYISAPLVLWRAEALRPGTSIPMAARGLRDTSTVERQADCGVQAGHKYL